MSSLVSTKHNSSSKSILHLLRYIVLIMAFLVVGMVNGGSKVEAADVIEELYFDHPNAVGGHVAYYDSLSAAFSGATNGNTIKLLGDVNECVTLGRGKETILNMNGYKLSCINTSADYSQAAISNAGILTIQGEGEIVSEGPNGAIGISNRGTLILEDVQISVTSNGSSNGIDNMASLTMTDVVIAVIGGANESRGVANFAAGVGELVDVEITIEVYENENAGTTATALYNFGELSITNIDITAISTSVYGIYNRGSLTINGGEIDASAVESNRSGVIYGIYNTKDLLVEDIICVATGIKPKNAYGIGNITSGVAEITNSEISVDYGNGIDNEGELTITNSQINATSSSGFSGILNGYGKLISTNNIITATQKDSYIISLRGISNRNEGVVEITGGSITVVAISSSSRPSGIFIKGGSALISGVMINVTNTTGSVYGIETNSSNAGVEIDNVTMLLTGTSGKEKAILNEGDAVLKSATVTYSTSGYLIENTSGTLIVKQGSYNGGIKVSGGDVVIGEQGGELSQVAPYFEGNIYKSSTDGIIKFYDGKIKGSCQDSSGTVECQTIVDEIEEGTMIVEENGYVYLDKAYVEEVTSDGTHVAYYDTLSEAFSDATSGNTIKLLDDINECGVQLIASQSLTLDLNGKSINCDGEKGLDVFGNLVINDSLGNGAINLTTTYAGSAIFVESGGSLTLNDGTVSSISSSTTSVGRHTAINTWGGTIVINGGNVYSERGSYSYGIYVSSVTSTSGGEETTPVNPSLPPIGGGDVSTTDLAVGDVSGLVSVEAAGKVTINGGFIESKAISRCSYGVFVSDYSSLIMNGGSVTSSAVDESFGIMNGHSSSINGGVVSATASNGDAAGVYTNAVSGLLKRLIIGSVGGDVSITNPEINGGLYKADTDTGSIKFYDGVIKKGNGDYTCGPLECSSIVDTIVSGYQFADNGNEAYLAPISAVEELTSKGAHVAYYDTLSAAFSGATSGNNIKLLDDIEECSVTLAAGKTVTLDLNGKVILCNISTLNEISVHTLKVSGDLTIMDSGEGGTVSLTSQGYTSAAVYIDTTGVVTLNSGIINAVSTHTEYTYEKVGNAVRMQGTLNINGGKIYSQKPYYSIGVYLTATTGRLIMNGGEIEASAIESTAYGVYSSLTDVFIEINDGVIRSNKTGLLASGQITMNGGTIIVEATDLATGVENQGTFELNGGTISCMSSGGSCTGVENPQTFIFNDGSISAKSTTSNAYGLFNNASWSNLTMNGGNVIAESSTVMMYAIGLKVSIGSAVIKGGTITATTSGTSYTYAIYSSLNDDDNASYMVTIGENDGTISTSNPELNGGFYVEDFVTERHFFYDGIIKKGTGYNACGLNSTHDCATYFYRIETNAVWVDDDNEAYLTTIIEEVDLNDVRVAYHGTLSAAFANGVNGNTIKLLDNINECSVELPSEKVLTLELNGKSVTCSTASSNVKVLNISGNLTIMDSIGEGSVSLNVSNYTAYGIYINSGGSVTLGSGTIYAYSSSTSSYYRIYAIYNLGALSMSGGKVYSQRSASAYGIYNSGSSASLLLSGGEVEVVGTSQYVVYNAGGSTMEMTGGVLKTGNDSGYVVYNDTSSVFTMDDGEMVGTLYGVYNKGTFNLNDGSITSTSSSSSSYGVYNTSIFIQTGGSIVSNSSTGYAYGVYATGSNTTITGGVVTAMASKYGGYALYSVGSSANIVTTLGIKDGNITNLSPEINGSLYVPNTAATLNFYNGIIKNGANDFVCRTGSGARSCSSLFDDTETGYGIVEDGTSAYLGIVIEELNSSGNRVATHATLPAAFANVTNNNTIKLLSNVMECDFIIENRKTLTLDMNGKTISCSSSGEEVYFMQNNGNLTIIGNGTFDVDYSYDSSFYCDTEYDGDTYNCVEGIGEEFVGEVSVIRNYGTLIIDGLTIDLYSVDEYYDSENEIYEEDDYGYMSEERPNYAYGIYNVAQLQFISGTVNVNNLEANDEFNADTTYSIYTTALEGYSALVIIGKEYGGVAVDNPALNGRVYIGIDSSRSKFFDGIINKGNTAYLCNDQNTCVSVFGVIESGANWVVENNSAYLEAMNGVLNIIEEVTSNGSHVAYYSMLDAAFSSATSGNTIKLLKNISECSAKLDAGKTLTLELNGKSVICTTSTSSTYLLSVHGNLTINDSGENGALTIDSSSYQTKAISIAKGGVVTLNGGIVSSISSHTHPDYMGYCITNSGTLIVNGGKVYAQKKYNSHGIFNSVYGDEISYLTINGGVIESYALADDSWAVDSGDAIVEINGGTIISRARNNAYGLRIPNPSVVTMNDGEIISNASTASYGVANYYIFMQNGGSITSNADTGASYGLYASAINTTIIGGTVTATSTSGVAYGVYNAGTADTKVTTLGIKDGNITNISPQINGGLYVDNMAATLNFYNGIIKSGANNFVCKTGSGARSCSSLFDDTETGYGVAEDGISAYLGIVIEELNSSGSRVATHVRLSDALISVTNNNTIRLLSNVTNECGFIIESGKTLTLDLNGKTISCSSSGEEAYFMQNNGNLTIIGNGTFDVDYYYDSYWSCDNGEGDCEEDINEEFIGKVFVIKNYGTLIIDGLTIDLYSYDSYDDSEWDTSDERPNYAYGIYNVASLEFRNGVINLVNKEANEDFNADTTYSIYTTTFEEYEALVIIGKEDGNVVDSPVLNGRVYIGIDFSRSKFFDGIINKGDTAYICNNADSCSTVFGVIESNTEWVVENNSAYLESLSTIVELTSEGFAVTYYGTLSAAFSGASSGNTVKLFDDISECNVVLASGKTLTLDMNGKKITCSLFTEGEDNMLLGGIINNGNLTVIGNGNLEVYHDYDSSGWNSGYTYGIRNTGTLVVDGLNILVSVNDSWDEINEELPNEVGGVCNYGVLDFISGTIDLDFGGAMSQSGFAFYGIFNDGQTINIGKAGGGVSTTDPEINGGIYTSTINFYDGVINKGFSTYVCSTMYGGVACLGFLDNIETGYELFEDGSKAYLVTGTVKIEESTTGGSFVANYYNLQSAFNNVNNGNTLKLLSNLEECSVELDSGKSAVLNLNGFNITCVLESDFVPVIDNDGNLTIIGGGMISRISEVATETPAINNSGTLTVSGGKIRTSGGEIGAFGIINNGTFIINGGEIEVTAGGFVTAIYNYGTIEIGGGKIYACSDDDFADGINNQGEVIMTGGEIEVASGTYADVHGIYNYDATTEISGGIIYVSGDLVTGVSAESGTVIITGGEINVSSESSRGIGVNCSLRTTLQISGGNISATTTSGVAYSVEAYSTFNLGIKDGNISADAPYLSGDVMGTFNFYDGKIYGSCFDINENAVECTTIVLELETSSKVVEKNGYVYLEYTSQSFQEFDASGNGGTIYSTLDAAFAGSTNGNTIKLLENYSGCATLASGKSFVLDLNGMTLSCNTLSNDSTSLITNNGSLTIKGSGTLEIKGEGSSKYGIYNTGTLIIEKGEINLKGNSLVGVYVNSGSFEMKGGTIIVNSDTENGSAKGIYIAGGSASLSGGIIQVISSNNDVYGIHNKGNLTITKAVISATTNLGEAKGLYNESGTTTLTGGVVNATSGKGGAYGVSTYDASQIQLSSTVNISAISTYGLAFDVHCEVELEEDKQVNAPVLFDEVVDGVETPVVCNYGSSCNIVTLTFKDYLGEVVSEVSNVITLNGQVVDSFAGLGTYTVTTVARDSYGNVSKEVVRTYNIVDNEAPVINVSNEDIVIKVGDSISGLYGASASDNYDTDLVIETICDDVDTSKEGTYKLGYKVVDSNGNETIVYRDVIVKDNANNDNNGYIYVIGGIGLFAVVATCVSLAIVKRRKNK